jgi:hypothetical protein
MGAASPDAGGLAWKLLELGHVLESPKTAALYAPMQEKEPYQGVRIERDATSFPAPGAASPNNPVAF